MATTRVVKDGRITASCDTCGESSDAPDKGLGRAVIAAWESRHQHPAPTSAASPPKPTPGQVWEQKQTAEMRRDHVRRRVVIAGWCPDFCGGRMLRIVPAPGWTGRSSIVSLNSFLRRFTYVEG